ncbi:helicase POLQ-like isoform X1 [Biomphalaria glabrata]|uniref:Helicase POLQ-like isoform X1 n=3 Tax=Biomphalaria glabrata TaxID=6526 RepID=A0A9W3BF22_BIOGL|nr:helicase POLQ-like isoform X1 [Biomphalaria glabrata]XP_055898013.1 helicase POLQ-like isoform X1 [Biomphalaria glabrata]XP_055898018.1 helicase POLQ-like isoform X1 [Biomphalaria glabrata]XP_055898024.1 helicase POLQ-like isoform X1 [Biomphalaria glabrata]XP_055898030.1 helicase POLQ-like isoform X1 [Biomphalaria glabrata]XP_055898037.1 helicase POLQ-like isoform X1 [Biomphalaria glabrata]XP_055898046.1 helicase POLQ-like isoform X1 [Biomphalaria glabrata]
MFVSPMSTKAKYRKRAYEQSNADPVQSLSNSVSAIENPHKKSIPCTATNTETHSIKKNGCSEEVDIWSMKQNNCDTIYLSDESDLFEDDQDCLIEKFTGMKYELTSDVTSESCRNDSKNKNISQIESSIKTCNASPRISGENIDVHDSNNSSEMKANASLINKTVSLKEKLKNKLKQNAATTTFFLDKEEEMKEKALQQARIEASQIRKEGTSVDIGSFFGLPSKVKQLFETNRGITKLYDWQVECLQLKAVQERKNLIYSLPTSGGKTLVAEILIMKELLCYQRDCMLILPFVSIVQEKVQIISEFANELDFIVEEYAGSKGRFPPTKRQKKKSLYIATIEKAHSIVNSLIESNRIDCLGLVVVDELHMIGEGNSRGATLESTLLKILTVKCATQIIGMSATLNNIKDLQTFLQAEVYSNDFRPVTLQEYVKVEDNIFKVNSKALDEDGFLVHERILTFPYTKEITQEDPDHLLGLVTEVIPEKSCLIFCATKKNCENVALLLSKLMCNHQRHLLEVNKDKRRQLLRELQQDGQGKLCPVLEYTVHFGIAYHHSGLTMDERRLIEEAYTSGVLCLLTCTSTLAAGVNLPAKRVILRSPYIGNSFIKFNQYKQMIGRAGRAGIDTSGESILIINSKDKMKVKKLLESPQDRCHSSLGYESGKGIKFFLLSAIGLKIVSTTKEAFEVMKKSLLHIQSSELDIEINSATAEALQFLVDTKLVAQTKSLDNVTLEEIFSLQVTQLGKATFKGSIDHAISCRLYEDLSQAKESLNLTSHLHLIYLVTPYDQAGVITPDWTIYFKQFCKLSDLEMKAAEIIGVPESYIGLKASGQTSRRKVCQTTLHRFYLALMLWQLWNQKSIWEVATNFSQTRGFLQNLLSQSASFASCVFHFCQELEDLWAYQDLLSNFVKKLAYCVTSELLPLMEVPGIKLARAKQLYAAGYQNVTLIAAADIPHLTACVPYLSKRSAKQIISAAKNVVEEKKAALLEEVETLVIVST